MEKIIISCLESRVETNRSIYARFLLGPFKNDQAVTIATALRRSLLSQVKNIAITAIHIQGVTHEFSTIVGVRESVLDLALNFQQVVLCAQSNKQTNVFNKGGVAKQSGAVQKRSFCNGGAFARTSEGRAKATLLQAAAKTKVVQKRRFCKSVLKTKRGNAQAKAVQKLCFCKPGVQNLVLQPPVGPAAGLFVTTGSLNQVGFDSNPVTPLKETTKIGYLQVQGPKIIYANDLKLPVGVKCVDPTQYIATLSTEGLLVVKFVIGEKKVSFEDNKEKLIANINPDIQNGYQNIAPAQLLSKRTGPYKKEAERAQTGAYKNKVGPPAGLFVTGGVPAFATGGALNKSSFNALQKNLSNYDSNKMEPYYADTTNARIFDSTISLRNTIFLDPIFDSVFKVNYLIEKDDLFNQSRERILLELWTNGSIHPRQALHTASLSLISTFSIFQNVFHLDSL